MIQPLFEHRLTLAGFETRVLELLEGIGHCPQIEAPDRFAKILLDFAGAPAAQAA